MAKKEGDWKSALMKGFKGQILGKIKDYFDNFVDKVNNAMVVTQKKIIRALTSLAFMLLGIVFLIIGAVFYFIDVLQYNRSTVLLLVGAILILISIILAQSAKLLKYDFQRR